MSKTREAFPLSEKKIIKKILGNAVSVPSFILLIILLITLITGGEIFSLFFDGDADLAIFPLYFLAFGILWLLSIIFNIFYQPLYLKAYYYELDDDHITIRKGVWMPHEITIPYERVQDIYVDQDFLDRIFGLYDVHLSSATFASGALAHIDGLERRASDGLKQLLMAKVREKIAAK